MCSAPDSLALAPDITISREFHKKWSNSYINYNYKSKPKCLPYKGKVGFCRLSLARLFPNCTEIWVSLQWNVYPLHVRIKLSEFLTAEIYLLRVREEFCQLALKFLNRQLVKTLEFIRCLDWLLHRTFIIVFVFNQVALVRFARHLFHCSFATSFWTNNHGVFFRSLGMESPSNELVLIAVQDLS